METFTKLPRVKSINQVMELRVIYDQLESTIRNLKSLTIGMESYGSFLVPLLLQKLPSELRMVCGN